MISVLSGAEAEEESRSLGEKSDIPRCATRDNTKDPFYLLPI